MYIYLLYIALLQPYVLVDTSFPAIMQILLVSTLSRQKGWCRPLFPSPTESDRISYADRPMDPGNTKYTRWRPLLCLQRLSMLRSSSLKHRYSHAFCFSVLCCRFDVPIPVAAGRPESLLNPSLLRGVAAAAAAAVRRIVSFSASKGNAPGDDAADCSPPLTQR